MRRTKTNLVRFLALLMAFGMLMGLSLLLAASPPVILAVTCAALLACAWLVRIEPTVTTSKARGKGRLVYAEGVLIPDQFAKKVRRRQWAHEYPTGCRCWRRNATRNRDSPVSVVTESTTSMDAGSQPSDTMRRASLRVLRTANLFAFNANDQCLA